MIGIVCVLTRSCVFVDGERVVPDSAGVGYSAQALAHTRCIHTRTPVVYIEWT